MSENRPDLYEQLLRLEWLMRRHQWQSHRGCGPMGDPHRGQGRVLALLKIKPEISQRELSDILDIRSQSLGELLAKLERSGYITRTPLESDRRVSMVKLTEAGLEAANRNEQAADGDSIFGCLAKEEQDTLNEYLQKIIGNLEEYLASREASSGRRGPHHRGHFYGEGYGPRINPGFYSRCGRPPHDDDSGEKPPRGGGSRNFWSKEFRRPHYGWMWTYEY